MSCIGYGSEQVDDHWGKIERKTDKLKTVLKDEKFPDLFLCFPHEFC